MIKITEEVIREMEQQHPGITRTIWYFENMEIPACPTCGSGNTASVQVGIIGRTIYLAAATSKFHLTPNGPKKGEYFCNVCHRYFAPRH